MSLRRPLAMNPFRSLREYELYIYTLTRQFPTIHVLPWFSYAAAVAWQYYGVS
jgi:hypothetical protein